MACSRSSARINESTGPNISSWAILISAVTSVNMVGRKKYPGRGLVRLPPKTSLAPSFAPICTYLSTFARCPPFMSGPISTLSSRPLPAFSPLALRTSFLWNSGRIFPSTMTRLAAVHRCPVVPKAPQSTPSTARSILASSMTIMGFLPPSSSETLFMSLPDSDSIHLPVSSDPVKDMAFTFLLLTRAAPASLPTPVTRFMTPPGTPAWLRILISSTARSGVSLEGLSTTVFPEIRAGMIFQAGIARGKLKGVINPTTPMGRRTVMQNLSGSSEGVVSPKSLLPSPAA